ncbi:restriction endonuclease [Pararhizobium sp. LjRoot238]|uniref:restriction endonuclease n=1 Tax=Pararhizobium sp. LjRoot238 TaxID=3342293 RepID=UPI003ED0D496
MAKYTHKKIAAKLAEQAAAGADEISPEQEGELKALGEGIRSLGRRTTEQALELGGYLARAKSILPEKALGAWVKAICKFTPKTARNYIAVHEHLSEYKDRLVTAAVAPTTLFVLAYAEQENVETVLSAIEAGEQLTVAQVKTMVGASPRKTAATAEVLNVGGLAGLRKVAELKVAEDAARFVGLVTAILAQVENALEPFAKGRAVKKGALQEAVVYDCRHAHDLINGIAAPLQPDVTAHMNWRPAKLPDGTAWRKVQALLQRMGGVDGWPDRTDFVPWLQNDVVPLLLAQSPTFFERAIVDLLVGMGYGGSHENAARRLGKTGDGGIDGVIDEDRLGLDRIYVQAKRYASHVGVGRPEVQAFVGSLVGFGATKGVFVTTSSFSTPATDFVRHLPQRIVLIDGDRLADLMIEHGVGVRVARTVEVKRLDEDFFVEE